MGLRGPAKTPTELKVVRGTQTSNDNEIKPDAAQDLNAPDWLTEESKIIWNSLAKMLSSLKLLTAIDLNGFARYCDIFPKWMKAKKVIDENGYHYPIYHKQTKQEIEKNTPKTVKYLQQYPEVSIYVQLGKELSRLEQVYGLNPSARVGLNVSLGSPGTNDVDDLLYG